MTCVFERITPRGHVIINVTRDGWVVAHVSEHGWGNQTYRAPPGSERGAAIRQAVGLQ